MKEILSAVLLPPGLAIVLALAAYYFLFTKRMVASVLLMFSIVIGWAFSTEAVGRALSAFLIAQIDEPRMDRVEKTDMIIALTRGMRYVGEVGWLPQEESYQRVAVAYRMQNMINSRVPVVISGGKTAGLRYPSEAKVAYDMFDRRDTQIRPTLLEENSTNTYESAMQVVPIARNREANTLMLVTSEVHMWRALAVYRGRGVDPIPVPVITVPRGRLTLRDYLPSWQGVALNAKAVHEIVGIVTYLVSGKIKVDDLTYNSNEQGA